MAVAEHTPPMSARDSGTSPWHWTNYPGLPIDMKAVDKAMPVLTDLQTGLPRRRRKLQRAVYGRPSATRPPLVLERYRPRLGRPYRPRPSIPVVTQAQRPFGQADSPAATAHRRRQGQHEELKKILEVVCDDGRVRGAFMFNGAVPTLRMAADNYPTAKLHTRQISLWAETKSCSACCTERSRGYGNAVRVAHRCHRTGHAWVHLHDARVLRVRVLGHRGAHAGMAGRRNLGAGGVPQARRCVYPHGLQTV